MGGQEEGHKEEDQAHACTCCRGGRAFVACSASSHAIGHQLYIDPILFYGGCPCNHLVCCTSLQHRLHHGCASLQHKLCCPSLHYWLCCPSHVCCTSIHHWLCRAIRYRHSALSPESSAMRVDSFALRQF